MAGMPHKNLNDARTAAATSRLFSQATAELPVADLLPSPENGRKKIRNVEGLADSFDDDGVVQALTVVTAATYIEHYPQHKEHVEASEKPYVVVHGHRRLAAAKKRGLEKVPVFLRKKIDGSIRLAAIKENEQRLGLDPIEQGADYQAALEELGISQRELSRKLGNTSQTAISHRIKLLKLIKPLRDAVVDHWCKQNGLEIEYGGELLLPVKEAATILAGLHEELQQAFVDGALSFTEAENIVKSKVPIEEQQLSSLKSETETNGDKQSTEPKPGTSSQQQTPAGESDGGGEGGQQDEGNGAEKNPVPSQRSGETDSDDEHQDGKDPQGAPETESAGTSNTDSATPGTSTSEESSSSNSSVATLTERGVIPVTTVQDIYTGLKERLTSEEFEELQDLILNE